MSESNDTCDNRRCFNGWIRWNGSDYPCGACEGRAREADRQREERREREGEAYAWLF